MLFSEEGIGKKSKNPVCESIRDFWWTHTDSNRGPLACEASALTS